MRPLLHVTKSQQPQLGLRLSPTHLCVIAHWLHARVVAIQRLQHIRALSLATGLVFDAQPQHLERGVVISIDDVQQALW